MSSAILALNSLLYPLKWCLALVPLLHNQLLDMIEAPMPILVGITRREYKSLQLTKEDRDSKIWVFLNEAHIHWNQHDHLPILHIANEQLLSEYANFTQNNSSATNIEQMAESHRSQHLNDNNQEADELQSTCKNVCSIIRQQIKQRIFSHIRHADISKDNYLDVNNQSW